MRRRISGCAVLLLAASAALTACGSSGGSSSGPSAGTTGGTSGSKTITIGFVTDLTGVASSGFLTSKLAIDAYLNRINAAGGVNGHKIKYILADTTSTPTGALTAVQKLVQQDNVFAIVEDSSDFFGADPKDTNLFASAGVTNEHYMNLASGQFMKSQGVTKCASLGYASSPSSALAAAGFVKSCEVAGLKSGYLNTQFPFGSTNVGPIALALKNAGVDGLFLPTVPSTSFPLVVALHSLGVKMKAIVLPTGYGGDLLASKPAVGIGQGVDFQTVGRPREGETAGSRHAAADWAKMGRTIDPPF